MPSSATADVHVVDDPRFENHRARGAHPERPERLPAARSGLEAALPASQRIVLASELADDRALRRIHDGSYVTALDDALRSGAGHLDSDTYFSEGSREAAWLAAGGAMILAEALARGEASRGVALLRPPGHHATPGRAMGFCLLNNVALAAAAALDAGARRVAIVDWDVHHGNGTQDAFYDDPRVLFVSMHQYPFYPGTGRPEDVGRGAGKGTTINVAVPAGSGNELYGAIFRRIVLPALDSYDADLTLVSAGFDAHDRDPLSAVGLESTAYGAMAGALLSQAERAGHGRVGFFLEGGYDLIALEESVASVGRALLGHHPELPEGRLESAEEESIARTVLAHRGLSVLR